MKHYWKQMSERDKRTLLIGGSITSLYLIYLLIISPLNHALTNQKAQWIDKQETLQFMQSVKIHTPPNDKTQKTNNAKLLSIITEQLNQSSIHQFNHQLGQTNAGEIELSFNQVPFTLFIVWLKTLNKQYALTFSRLTVNASETEGIVKLSLILSAE